MVTELWWDCAIEVMEEVICVYSEYIGFSKIQENIWNFSPIKQD